MLKEFLSIRNDLSFSNGCNSLEEEIRHYWKIEAWLDVELKRICIKLIDKEFLIIVLILRMSKYY
ncbi:hypothetical protein I4Q68_000153 [Campylobacter lari]|nr:hypothetical protein [Campylobacter lari]EGQ5681641.1 hypothetical protein [Campylobacter lari]